MGHFQSNACVELLENRRLLSASLLPIATFSGAPFSNLIVDTAGNLYGTASDGGPTGNGTVFRLSAGKHALWTLATFDGIDGSNPSGGLVADPAGDLFGTTQLGGLYNQGTVFEVMAGSHKITSLVSFDGTNGQTPDAGLVIDSSGNLCGTTKFGGTDDAGTVFKLNIKTDSLATLASMNPTLGELPQASLVVDHAGNLYGTTTVGGTGGTGTVFKIAAGTNNATALASFDGSYSFNGYLDVTYSGYLNMGRKSALVIDAAGNLYGTVFSSSTIFKVSTGTDAITILATFSPPDENTAGISGLVMDTGGNLFGTTQTGGQFNSGSVFKVAAGTDKVTTVLSLGGSRQFTLATGLTADKAGNLYGAATGKTGDDGTIFEITGL